MQDNSTVGKGVGKDELNADMEHSTGHKAEIALFMDIALLDTN